MNTLLVYLVQSGFSLGLFYGLYWFLLRNDASFKANRYYLLISVVFSFIIPLIKIRVPLQTGGHNYLFVLEDVIIKPNEAVSRISGNVSFMQFCWAIYLAGSGFFLVRLCIQLFQIVKLIRKFGINKVKSLNIIFVNDESTVFSFLNFIFIGSGYKDHKHFDRLLAHEEIHLKQKHTADLLLLEIVTIFQWFNPVIWLYKKSFRQLHEYLADQGVLSNGVSKSDYQNMLVNQSFGIQYNYITNHFSQSLIKRRIIMMSKNQKMRFQYFKAMLVLPVSMIMVLFFSISFVPDLIAQESTKPETKGNKITVKDQSVQNEEIFTVVEEMPKYPGGEEARIKFMVENIKYPEEARKSGVEGTVYVSFVVERDGKISNVKTIRGIGSGCDEEAERVISLMPDWKPGIQKNKPVRTQFNMPIKFSLDKSSKKIEGSGDIEKKNIQSQPEKKLP